MSSPLPNSKRRLSQGRVPSQRSWRRTPGGPGSCAFLTTTAAAPKCSPSPSRAHHNPRRPRRLTGGARRAPGRAPPRPGMAPPGRLGVEDAAGRLDAQVRTGKTSARQPQSERPHPHRIVNRHRRHKTLTAPTRPSGGAARVSAGRWPGFSGVSFAK